MTRRRTTAHRTLPVTTFLTCTVLLSIISPPFVLASPALPSTSTSFALPSPSPPPPPPSPSVQGQYELRSALAHGDEEMHEHDHAHHAADGLEASGDVVELEALTHGNSAVTSSYADAVTLAHSASSSTSTALRPVSDAHAHHAGHDHGSHEAAKTTLDDVAIHKIHSFPPTYLDQDFYIDASSVIFGEEFDDEWDAEMREGHRGLMVTHILGMCGAYFGALPIALALRAAGHPAHYIANAIFLVIASIGWLAGAAYKAATPDRYEGAVHHSMGNMLFLLSISLAVLDSLGLLKRAVSFYKLHDWSWSAFTHHVLWSSKDERFASRYEMVGLMQHDDAQGQLVFGLGEDEDADDEHEASQRASSKGDPPRRPALLTRQWSPPSRNSTGSEGTLHDTWETPATSASTHAFDVGHKSDHEAYTIKREPEHPIQKYEQTAQKIAVVRRIMEIVFTCIRRAQVVMAYVLFLTGFTMYTGMCRAGLINSCAAHYIKGSIFFLYGLLTFGRYLGAYADLGWAWNRRPGGNGVTAEMVECAVIFTYGITNTWMERFGAQPDAPYTVKQVQHISIAVMFWFAGLTGMLLESRWLRELMGSVVSGGRTRNTQNPPSYMFSFNPLPALVIAVTGLAMAAHHQEYVFQVQIHSLWGILLAGGSVFRLLTYFFLYLRPPVESTLPSRPPTELLTSFGWAAGGTVFMLSNEEIAWAAMRAGFDDMMAFLNFTIALTSLLFCWIVVVMVLKGWAVVRLQRDEKGEGGGSALNRRGRASPDV